MGLFLHFLQKKGWLGVPLNKTWGDGDKNYIYNSIQSFNGENYFNDFLEPLFYEALNSKRSDDVFNGVKIPFLNGGLFSPIENYNWKTTNFNIPNEIWFNKDKKGFLDILHQYNFTIDESDPTEQDIAVDPEMLGRIFESLLDSDEGVVPGVSGVVPGSSGVVLGSSGVVLGSSGVSGFFALHRWPSI